MPPVSPISIKNYNAWFSKYYSITNSQSVFYAYYSEKEKKKGMWDHLAFYRMHSVASHGDMILQAETTKSIPDLNYERDLGKLCTAQYVQ